MELNTIYEGVNKTLGVERQRLHSVGREGVMVTYLPPGKIVFASVCLYKQDEPVHGSGATALYKGEMYDYYHHKCHYSCSHYKSIFNTIIIGIGTISIIIPMIFLFLPIFFSLAETHIITVFITITIITQYHV